MPSLVGSEMCIRDSPYLSRSDRVTTMSDGPLELSAGVLRTDLAMADGRTIRYYDQSTANGEAPVTRAAIDHRAKEERPPIADLRLDALTNEWTTVASHRQGRVFLPPKELCPLCPTKPGLESEIADTSYQVVVFDNRSPSFAHPGDCLLYTSDAADE